MHSAIGKKKKEKNINAILKSKKEAQEA